jgi:hypothetical protein
MELVHDVEKVGGLLPKINPAPFVTGIPGIAPPRMDHLLVTAEEVGEAATFYTSVLGFRITEQLLDGNGHQIGTWMERSFSPHDLAIVWPSGHTTSPGSTTGSRCAKQPHSPQRHPTRRRSHASRHHPWLHDLLLRPAGHPQRGVHRRLSTRP